MKAQLKIVLVGDKTLRISIVYLCDEAMANGESDHNKLYKNAYTDIVIWSFGEFSFNERQIKFPTRKRLLSKLSYQYQFKSEEERYLTLRKYYSTLNDWALCVRLFPNTDTTNKKRITLTNEYWTVL